MRNQFGGKASKALIDRYAESPNWKDGRFENLEETKMEFSIHALPKMLYKQFCDTQGREPATPIDVLPFDRESFLGASDQPKIIWYGHAVVLMRWKNKTILIDPMLGPDASPIAPFKTKRFSEETLALIDEFPPIDLLLMSHDHYDHLDLASIKKLKDKTSLWFVALGVGRHLEHWGVSSSIIKEFDWWDSVSFEGIDFTFTPSRHFSGRGLTDRFKSLWGGWVMQSSDKNIYWSGDGGYGDHFKYVGSKFDTFDFGFFECGQYNENWRQIHMFPEESVQAALDANVKKAMAVHWGAFALAQHTWTDPIERFTKAAKTANLNTLSPSIGSQFTLDTETAEWWQAFR